MGKENTALYQFQKKKPSFCCQYLKFLFKFLNSESHKNPVSTLSVREQLRCWVAISELDNLVNL